MAPWLPKRERDTDRRTDATQENTLYRRSSPITETQRPSTQEMAFSRPITTAVGSPKTALDSGLVATAEHTGEHPRATRPLTSGADPPSSDMSIETPITVTDEQRISPCSRIHACCKQLSGEICRKRHCSHLCTGQLKEVVSALPPPNAVQQTSIRANGFTPPIAPSGPGPSDDDSDPDSVHALLMDSSWHPLDRHRGSQLVSLLHYPGSLEPNGYSTDSVQVETDHGCSHATATESHDSEPFFIPWSVQESNTQRPGQQELVITEPLKFVVPPTESRDSLLEGRHVYLRPFVCNMPELQPSFVGEMRGE